MTTRPVGGRRPSLRTSGSTIRRRFAAPLVTSVFLGLVGVPLALLGLPTVRDDDPVRLVSLASAILGAGALMVAAALPSRVRLLTRTLGVERMLRYHRAFAVAALVLVVVHVDVALAHHGIDVMDLRVAPPRVWAATTASVGLVLLVAFGLLRRRRRPRYEGWRLAHVLLAYLVLAATTLHVLWLQDLVRFRAGQVWFAVLAGGVVVLGAHRWVLRPLRALRRRYVVDEVRAESATAVTLVVRARGHRGTPFRAGQFAWLKIGDSPFVFEEHPFTIASSAAEPWRKEFTIKALGDFTEVVAGLRPGRAVHLDGPHGAFTVTESPARGLVLIAGGVGITPMLSMLRTLADAGDVRPVLLVVAGRTADDLLHRADHEDLEQRLRLQVVEVLEDPPVDWTGDVGRLTEEILAQALPTRRMRARHDYFLCGPGPMVVATMRVLRSWGVPSWQINTELFDVV